MEADQVKETFPKALCIILDIGIAQPLYIVAQKCRDVVLRRKAIEGMKQVKKERVHDLLPMVGALQWIFDVAEGGLEKSDGVSLEVMRLYDVELDFNDAAENCKVAAWRRRPDGGMRSLSAL